MWIILHYFLFSFGKQNKLDRDIDKKSFPPTFWIIYFNRPLPLLIFIYNKDKIE